MTIKDDILHELGIAEQAIANAKSLTASLPDEGEASEVYVHNGDDLKALVTANPDDTIFALAEDFVQDVGAWTIPKPCSIMSEGGARLTGNITCAPNVTLDGLNINGGPSGTIITAANGTEIVDCIINGNPNGQQRGVAVNAEGIRITNTKILNIFKDVDTQAICGWNGTKDLVVSGCELEASGENVMFGGSDSKSEDLMPRDILIENCKLMKKPEWGPDKKAGCKNLLELKCVVGFTMRNCTMEYSMADGQIGYGIVIHIRNQSGSAPWTTIKDVLIEDCVVRHVAGGISFLGRDDLQQSEIMENVTIKNVRFEDVNETAYGANGRCIFISGGPKNTILDGLYFDGTSIDVAIMFDQAMHKCENLQFLNCELVEGDYGIQGPGTPIGVGTLEAMAPGYTWTNMKVHKSGARTITWPEGTIFI